MIGIGTINKKRQQENQKQNSEEFRGNPEQ